MEEMEDKNYIIRLKTLATILNVKYDIDDLEKTRKEVVKEIKKQVKIHKNSHA